MDPIRIWAELASLPTYNRGIIEMSEQESTTQPVSSTPKVWPQIGDDIALTKAFVEAQSDFDTAVKTVMNSHLKNKYADLADVIKAIRPALTKHGFAFTQPVEKLGTTAVIVRTILIYKTGAVCEVAAIEVPVPAANAQGLASAVTYGRRIGLNTGLGIMTDEDDDGNMATAAATKTSGPAMDQGKLANFIAAIEGADLATLLKVTNSAKTAAGTDEAALGQLSVAYKRTRARLEASEKAR